MDGLIELQKRIVEAEACFFKLFSLMQSPAAIFTLPEERIVNVNYRFLQLFGYSLQELSGKTLAHIGLLADSGQYEEAKRRTIRYGYLREFGCAFKSRSGDSFSGKLFADYMLIDGQKFLLLQIVDISAEQRMAGNLTMMQEQIDSLMEQVKDGYIKLDKSSRILYANKEAERLLDQRREQLIGRKIRDEYPVENDSNIYRAVTKAQKESIVTSCEDYHPRTRKWVEAHFYPMRDGMSIFVRDITQRKQEEEALKRSQQEFKTLVENLTDAIVRYDREFRYIYVNPAFVRLTGLRESEVMGKTWDDLNIAKEYSDSWRKYYNKVVFTGRELVFMAIIPSPAGPRYCQIHAAPELDNSGKVEHILAIVRDVTEYKQMEKEMARLERLNLVGEMAASIGHEVRNPMTTVRGFLQMLSLKRDLGKYNGFFGLMIEEIDRANSIITEYLSLAKNKTIDTKPANLNKIINTVLPLIQADALRMGMSIVCSLDSVPDLMLDEKEIRQCIFNLVRNGLEAMDKGGTVTITTWEEAGSVSLAVKDEGRGIPRDIMDKIGTPFLTTKETGTGLGLSVCYSIAKRHNAKIKVDTGPGGTTFFIRFNCMDIA